MFAFLVTACNSFLDVVPDNRTELDSPEAIKELLVSLIRRLTITTCVR